jgi:phosphonate transport system permease protein
MSAEAPARSVARPRKPPPTLFAIAGVVVFVVVTIAAGFDWAFGVGFSLTTLIENFTSTNPAFEGLRDINWTSYASENVRRGFIQTFQMAAIATILGALVGLPLALLNSVIGAPNRITYVVVKNFNSVIRAVPDLVYAVFFVAAIGRGVLPGVLALFFLSVGIVAKLTSDTIDGIDPGPVESAKAAGASHVQVLRTAVLPQILPGYVSFSLYTFEINLRGSAVLGFVSAGGIGELLSNYYQRAQWDRMWGVVVGFFVVVFIVDRLSIAMRKRLL